MNAPDRDAITLSGHDYDCMVDTKSEAESAICELLQELDAARQGCIIDKETALGAVLTINTSIRMMMQTVNAASKRGKDQS
jgi:hypothetical protein